MTTEKEFAGIEYAGIGGASIECQEAVMRLLQCRVDIESARILSHADGHTSEHALLIKTRIGEIIAIKSGFTSGYAGTGPSCFSATLRLLEKYRIEIDECDVNEALIRRLDDSALTNTDIKAIEATRPVRPTRWHDYILDRHYRVRGEDKILREFEPVIPYAIIDTRINDLAIEFWDNPDDMLLKGYRRLEDTIRNRTNSTEHGQKLFAKVFNGKEPALYWKDLQESEKSGRANLFIGAYSAHRNPRAHRELKANLHEQLSEFLLLNHLFRLEREALLAESNAA